MQLPRAEPVPPNSRIAALDVIRGIALFGILVVNMAFFATPLAAAVVDPTIFEAPRGERVMWWIEKIFFDGKFISTFSLLFGAGLALQMMRLDDARAAARRDGQPARSTELVIVRRLAILAVLGTVHATLLWYGDILFFYAVLAWPLLSARHLAPKAMATIGVVLLALSLCCTIGLAPGPHAPLPLNAALESQRGEQTNVDVEAILLSRLEATHGDTTHPSVAEVETLIYRDGPTAAALTLRVVQWTSGLPLLLLLFGPHILAMYMLGMAAAKARLFSRAAVRAQRLAAFIGVPFGVGLCAVATTLQWQSGLAPETTMYLVGTAFGDVGTATLAIGYAGVIARLTYVGVFGGLAYPVACAGRMALTVYLSETVIVTGVMYWWGLGQFGRFSRVEHFIVAMATWSALVVVSTLWMSRFRMGPLEWLWRIGTYLTLPSLLKQPRNAASAPEPL
ncbi:MAG: DUF418 domain-containing protein [Phycisphaerae bacterium]|nr:DUF418 domain-containing protein [Phycisphaerae bacterium]